MLYIKKLDIVNEDNLVVYRICNTKAIDGLSRALEIVKAKEGVKAQNLILKKLKDLDKEFIEYFKL